jgi:hypothetical protein
MAACRRRPTFVDMDLNRVGARLRRMADSERSGPRAENSPRKSHVARLGHAVTTPRGPEHPDLGIELGPGRRSIQSAGETA